MLEYAKKYEDRLREMFFDIAFDQFYRFEEYAVYGLHIIHFGGSCASNRYVFGKDVMTAIRDIFEKYRFNKLNFTVVRGNPVEKTYDKLIKRYNGRIVGIKEQETKLIDGRLYDVKEYELLAERYFGRNYG